MSVILNKHKLRKFIHILALCQIPKNWPK